MLQAEDGLVEFLILPAQFLALALQLGLNVEDGGMRLHDDGLHGVEQRFQPFRLLPQRLVEAGEAGAEIVTDAVELFVDEALEHLLVVLDLDAKEEADGDDQQRRLFADAQADQFAEVRIAAGAQLFAEMLQHPPFAVDGASGVGEALEDRALTDRRVAVEGTGQVQPGLAKGPQFLQTGLPPDGIAGAGRIGGGVEERRGTCCRNALSSARSSRPSSDSPARATSRARQARSALRFSASGSADWDRRSDRRRNGRLPRPGPVRPRRGDSSPPC